MCILFHLYEIKHFDMFQGVFEHMPQVTLQIVLERKKHKLKLELNE